MSLRVYIGKWFIQYTIDKQSMSTQVQKHSNIYKGMKCDHY